MKKGYGVLVVIVLSIFPLLVDNVGAETVRIGLLLPFTGPLAQEGRENFEGITVAADMVNARGGLWGKKIEFIKGDAVTVEAGISEMERLITKEGLDLITGGYSSSRVFAESVINEKYKKVFWTGTCGAENITSRGFKYIFRFNAPTSSYGKTLIRFASEKIAPALKKKAEDVRVAIINEDSLWGTSVSDVQAQDGRQAGFKIVLKESYSNRTVDLSPLIMKLRAAKPDIIFATGYVNDTHLFWRQCKELDFDFAAFLDSGAVFTHQEWQGAFGKDVNGTIGLAMSPPLPTPPQLLNPKATETQKECLRLFAEKFNQPRPGNIHMLAFEAVHVLLTDILPKAGSLNPEKVREEILKLNRNWKDSPIAQGARYAPPGAPDAGANVSSIPFIDQWQNEKLVCCYPDHVATGKLMIPMPTWEERKKSK